MALDFAATSMIHRHMREKQTGLSTLPHGETEHSRFLACDVEYTLQPPPSRDALLTHKADRCHL